MNNISEIFVINLPECKKRMMKFDQIMKKFDLNYTVRQAIKGTNLTNEDLQKFTSYWCRHFTCTNGLIGCYLSHFFLWKDLSERKTNKIEWYLILEDDSHITKEFITNISAIFDDLRNWNYSNKYPEYINCASSVGNLSRVTGHLYKGILVNGTSAYLLSYPGANKLIRHMDKKINYHVDLTLSWHNLKYDDLHFYCTRNFIINSDENTSTISNSYPKLIPWLISLFYKFFGINNHYHIIYDSSIIVFHRYLPINITILIYVILLAISITFVTSYLLIFTGLIFICEIIITVIDISIKKTQC